MTIRNSEAIKILFICHASTDSGMGHLWRTSNVSSVCARYANTKVAMLGLHSLCKKMQHFLPQLSFIENDIDLLQLADEWNPDCICFDLLTLKDDIFNSLTKHRLSVSISPIFSHIKHVNLIFHRTNERPAFWDEFEKDIHIFSGLQYAVMDDRVIKIPTAHYKNLLKNKELPVGISMGGTDAANKTLMLLNTFRNLPVPMLFWVLLGEGYTHSYEALVDALAGSQHEVLLIKSNRSMWKILNQCALIFLGGGVTTYEAAYTGLPSINLLETEAHSFLLNELSNSGALVYITGTQQKLCEQAFSILCSLDQQREKLLLMHLSAKKCGISQDGALNIVKSIIYYIAMQRNIAKQT